jgi:predicted 3-demethylubiquinone-9 3-methyltransferase (glyoxalase superfamily)
MPLNIAPCIWLDSEAEEAAHFYVGVFKNSRIVTTAYYPDNPYKPAGSVLQVEVELDGQPFTLLNGGPGHELTDALSFEIRCDDQAEVDEYWERLTDGGEEVACGWLKDRYGVSWQVVPRGFYEVMNNSDKGAVQRAFDAMMQMKKLDLGVLEAAAARR